MIVKPFIYSVIFFILCCFCVAQSKPECSLCLGSGETDAHRIHKKDIPKEVLHYIYKKDDDLQDWHILCASARPNRAGPTYEVEFFDGQYSRVAVADIVPGGKVVVFIGPAEERTG